MSITIVYLVNTKLQLPLVSAYPGGAGGKGTWGKLTEMYDEDGHTRDARDPNYDSDSEVRIGQ